MQLNSIVKADADYIFESLSDTDKKFFENATILITGAAGFLGFSLLHFLCLKRADLKIKEIFALDNFMLRTPQWLRDLDEAYDFLKVKKFDVINDDLSSVVGSENADVIIHMASIASPIFYRKYPIKTIDANITGLRKLLDFYNSDKLKGLLFFSSSEIYGDPDPAFVPTDEEYRGLVSCTGPRACYDESKRFGETICMLYAHEYHLPITVVRPFNNYGPGMDIDDKRVPADFAKAVLQGQDIEILSDGTPRRTFCYVADAVVGYLKALALGHYDYFNIGMDKPEISIADLAAIYQEAIKELANSDVTVKLAKSQDANYLTHNPQRRCPIINKARQILNYDPKIEVHSGIKRYLSFLLEEQKLGRLPIKQ